MVIKIFLKNIVMDLADLVGIVLGALMVILTPYTKVEESFGIQAVHDILKYGFIDLGNYDHNIFPGVVPRSFIGPLILATFVKPFELLGFRGMELQIVTRLVLLVFVVLSQGMMRRAFSNGNKRLSNFIAITFLSQFHLTFYASRTLPNTFALVLIQLALAHWFSNRVYSCIQLLALSTIVFRCDTVILAIPIIFQTLAFRQVSVFGILTHCVPICVLATMATVYIDSYFWGYTVWPELSVLLFNSVENRSSEWGTLPLYWYFFNAIPRSLMLSVYLLPIGILCSIPSTFTWPSVDRCTLFRVLPSVVFVSLYSLLPHKELRFIFPAIAVLTCVAGLGAWRVWISRCKSWTGWIVWSGVVCMYIVNIAGACLMLYVSSLNYPGGVALSKFHKLLPEQEYRPSVHLSNLACISGVTHFGELPLHARYDKTEGLQLADLTKFDYLISELESVPGFTQLEVIDSFGGIRFHPYEFPPISVSKVSSVFIHRRYAGTALPHWSTPILSPVASWIDSAARFVKGL